MDKPYGVKAERLWLKVDRAIQDPKIGEPYASWIEAEIDAYVERRVRAEREACAKEPELVAEAYERYDAFETANEFREVAAAIRNRSGETP